MTSRRNWALLWGLILVLLVFSVSCTASRYNAKGGWSGPVLVGNTVYVGTRQGTLLALDIATGDTRWKFSPPKGQDMGPVYGTPAVGPDGWVYVGGYDGTLYGIDASSAASANGASMSSSWEFTANGSIIGGPTVADGKVLVGSSDGNLYALDAHTGKPVWATPFKTNNEVWSQPTVDNGIVYFGSLDHNLYAVDLSTGKHVWSFETKGGIASKVEVVGNNIYFGTFEGTFYALGKATGNELDHFQAGGWIWASPISDDSNFYFGSLDNKFYALNKSDLKPAWAQPIQTNGQIVGSATIVGNVVAFPSGDGNLYVASKINGKDVQKCSIGSAINAPLGFEGNTIYLAAMNDSIDAITIDSSTGRPSELWSRFTNKDQPEPQSAQKAC